MWTFEVVAFEDKEIINVNENKDLIHKEIKKIHVLSNKNENEDLRRINVENEDLRRGYINDNKDLIHKESKIIGTHLEEQLQRIGAL